MEGAESRLALDPKKIAGLLAQLNDEYRRARLGLFARFLFRSLQVVAYALPAVVFLAPLASALSDAAEARPLLPYWLQVFLDENTPYLRGLVRPLVFAVLLLAAANFKLAAKAFRQWQLARRLAALELADNLELGPPAVSPRFARLKRRASLLFLLPSTFFLLLFLYGLFQEERPVSRLDALGALFLLVFLPFLVISMDRLFAFLERRFRHFEEIAALKEKVEEGGAPSWPPGLTQRLGFFERVHLLRATAEQLADAPAPPAAAAESASEQGSASWVVELAPAASEALAALEPEQREEIGRLLDELCRQPDRGAPLGARGPGGEAQDLRWYSPPGDHNLAIVYELRHQLRRIHLLQLKILDLPSRRVFFFFSYSREDGEWFARLREELAALETFDIYFWSDAAIEPGQSWFEEISRRVAEAQGAFVLLSANYLQSDFIRRHELPQFLDRAENAARDFIFLWVPLAPVENLGDDELGRRILSKQAVGDPRKPLIRVPARGRQAELRRLRDLIHRAIYRRFQRRDPS